MNIEVDEIDVTYAEKQRDENETAIKELKRSSLQWLKSMRDMINNLRLHKVNTTCLKCKGCNFKSF